MTDKAESGAAEAGILDARLSGALAEVGIPPRPAILDRVLEETRKDDPDFHRLGDLIGKDVALAAGLIKTANSPYFGRQARTRSAREALLVLGLRAASQAIAGLVLRQVLPAGPRLERFWDASAHIAEISGWLAGKLGSSVRVQAEDAYTYGLFRDCGIPIMMRHYPDYFETLSAANRAAAEMFTDVEEARHPTNHAMLGSIMAQSWWLPEEISLSIRHHHDFIALASGVGMPRSSRMLIALGQTAEWLMQEHTGMSRTCEWQKMGEACMEALGISDGALAELSAEAGEEVLGVDD